MLPAELLAILFFARSGNGFPQIITLEGQSQVPNNTDNVFPPPTSTNFFPSVHDESTTTGFETGTNGGSSSMPGAILTSMQGFEDTSDSLNAITPRPVVTPQPDPPVVVTSTPSIVAIQTSVAPAQNGPNAPAFPSATASPKGASANAFLMDIISHIAGDGEQQHGALDLSDNQGSAPAVVANTAEGLQVTQETAPGMTAAPAAQSTAAVLGALMTLAGGLATLTLTPGLSTTVGSGSAATYIAITADGAGHTIITLSSSGTAVTATVTNAPTTVTIEGTGFAARITDDAGQLGQNSHTAASTTTSRAGAVSHKGQVNLLFNILLGIAGLGVFQ